jgi:hypothetical protein
MAGAFDIKLDTKSSSQANGGTWNQGAFIIGNANAVSQSADSGGLAAGIPKWAWVAAAVAALIYAKKKKVI